MIDLSKLAPAISQIVALTNISGGAVAAAVNLVSQIKLLLAQHGYESDSKELDVLIADAIRRQAIAAKEKTADA